MITVDGTKKNSHELCDEVITEPMHLNVKKQEWIQKCTEQISE